MGSCEANQKTIPIHPEVWYIGFFPSDGMHWYERFLDPDYAHVSCWRYDPDLGRWLFLDWSHNQLNILTVSSDNMSHFIHYKNPEVLRVELPIAESNKRHLPSFPMYCVSFVKHCLGIKGCTTITPKQLYKRLIKSDRVSMFRRRV